MGRNIQISGLLILIVVLMSGCASDSDPVVFKLKDKQMTLSEVKEAYNRFQYPKLMRYMSPEDAYQTDPWAEADYDTRAQYIETLTRKDLIVTFAREFYGDEFTGRDKIAYNAQPNASTTASTGSPARASRGRAYIHQRP